MGRRQLVPLIIGIELGAVADRARPEHRRRRHNTHSLRPQRRLRLRLITTLLIAVGFAATFFLREIPLRKRQKATKRASAGARSHSPHS